MINKRKIVLPVILSTQFLVGFVFMPLRSFMPLFFRENLLFSVSQVSLVIALGQALAMASSLIAGTLSARWGRKAMILLGLILLSCGPLLFFTGSGILAWGLAVLFLPCTSYLYMGGMGTVIAASSPDRRGVFSALFHWGLTLGGVLGSLAAGGLLDSWGYPSLGTVMFFLALTAVFHSQVLLPRERPGRAEDKQEGKEQPAPSVGYGTLLKDKTILMIGLARFLPTLYWAMALIILPLMIKDLSRSHSAVALYGAVSMVLATLAQITVGRYADRRGIRSAMYISYGGLILSIAGLVLSLKTLWGLFFFGSTAACSAWALSTLMPVVIGEFVSSSDRDRVLGFVQSLWSGAMILGSLTIGILSRRGYGLPFILALVMNGAGLYILTRLFRRQPS